MSRFLRSLLCVVTLVWATVARAEETRPEALPLTVFRHLHAGAHQTVITYGTSLTHAAEWPKALQAYLERRFPGQVTFLNSASSGKQSIWGLENFEESVLSKNPDLVFIEFSANDAATKHSISLADSRANLDRLVNRLRERRPEADIVIMTMNPAWDAPGEPSGKKYGSDRPHLDDYYAVYRDYARSQHLPLVDHELAWKKLRQEDQAKFERWVPDGIHPNAEASLAVTWPAIEALLEKASEAAKAPAPAQ